MKNQLILKIWVCPYINHWIQADLVKVDWTEIKKEIKLKELIYLKLSFLIIVMIVVSLLKNHKITE